MTKRMFPVLIALVLALSFAVSASAEYETPVYFTVMTSQTQAAGDYTSDALGQYIQEKFNVTYDAWPVAYDSQSEKVRVWVNSESMPTMTTWIGFNLSEYLEYVDQGLIAALPDGWEETYPNLYAMAEQSGILSYLTVDGATYGIPHATFGRFANFEPIIPVHDTMYYRTDWAKELGYEFGPTTPISEFKAYLKDCVENDMSKTGSTYGLVATASYTNNFFARLLGVDYSGFMEFEDGMEWAPRLPETVEAIKTAREWYREGLFHPDYYLYATGEINDFFFNGYAAAIFRDGPVSVYAAMFNNAAKQGLPQDSWGCTLVTHDDGAVYAMETNNYWTITMFNPDNDEETMDRVLALTDWLCTEEGIYYTQMGIQGVEWDLGEDGYPYMLDAAKNADGTVISQYDRHNSYRIWRQLGYLSDDFNFVSPAYETYLQEMCREQYALKAAADVIIPRNRDYDFFASETKNIFSVDVEGAMTKFIIGEDDIDSGWAQFIEENKGMWEPLLNELDATYYNK